jgi:hypothetical protein
MVRVLYRAQPSASLPRKQAAKFFEEFRQCYSIEMKEAEKKRAQASLEERGIMISPPGPGALVLPPSIIAPPRGAK